jgi:hypothetical protein
LWLIADDAVRLAWPDTGTYSPGSEVKRPGCRRRSCGRTDATRGRCRSGRPALPCMTRFEATAADLQATSASPDSHPVQFRGAITAAALAGVEDGTPFRTPCLPSPGPLFGAMLSRSAAPTSTSACGARPALAPGGTTRSGRYRRRTS